MKLFQGLAKERVIGAGDRIETGEHKALGRLVSRQRMLGRIGDRGDGVADLGIADALEPGCDVPDIAGAQIGDRH